MATSSRSAERFKYGICLNDECPLCKEKKVQQIPMRKDLVCSECGKPLRECPPPRKKGVDSKLIGIIAAILIVLAGAGFGIYSSMGGTKVDKIILDKESVSLIVDKKDVIKPTVLDKDGNVLLECETIWAVIDFKTRKPLLPNQFGLNIEYKDEQWVEQNINNSTTDNTNHGIRCIALQTHLVVEG